MKGVAMLLCVVAAASANSFLKEEPKQLQQAKGKDVSSYVDKYAQYKRKPNLHVGLLSHQQNKHGDMLYHQFDRNIKGFNTNTDKANRKKQDILKYVGKETGRSWFGRLFKKKERKIKMPKRKPKKAKTTKKPRNECVHHSVEVGVEVDVKIEREEDFDKEEKEERLKKKGSPIQICEEEQENKREKGHVLTTPSNYPKDSGKEQQSNAILHNNKKRYNKRKKTRSEDKKNSSRVCFMIGTIHIC